MKTRILEAISSIGLLAGALALVGCQSSPTVNTLQRDPGAQRQMVNDKRIVTDSGLAKRVSVVGVSEAPTPGGHLQVQVEVMNRTSSMQRFSYEFQWFDFNGMQVKPTSVALIPATIEGGETLHLSSVAPTPLCKDFRVKFIERK